MVNVKKVQINKTKTEEDQPFSYVFVLGLQIMKLVKKGYRKFEITDEGDKVLVRAWKVPKHG